MNQTLNNLRAILHKHKENMPVIVVAELLAEIDEAEADVCVWKWRIEDGKKVYSNCLYKADNRFYAYSFKYCPYCGKIRKEEVNNEADI